MRISGIRVQVTGSAATETNGRLLEAAHQLVARLADALIEKGAGLVLGVGDEPSGQFGPLIFDWTALALVTPRPDPAPNWPRERHGRFVVVASQRALEKIPGSRSQLWRECIKRTDFMLKLTPAGWKMASLIRQEQLVWGDVLIVLGGGAGVEHLAQMYSSEAKPVIPIKSDLGSVNRDGRGGGSYLHREALADTDAFFQLAEGVGTSTARLSGLELSPSSDLDELASAVVSIVEDLRPQQAFYVRLMTHDHSDYAAVEEHFRGVVDPVVESLGFEPHEVGLHAPTEAFINVEIFESIHRAGIVLVDLTGVRPNCMLELGYALGRRRRVILSARRGTTLPFDTDKLPTYYWNNEDSVTERQQSFRDWFCRYVGLPPVVAE